MARLTHVKYLVIAALAGLGIVMACGSPMTPSDPVPLGPGVPEKTAPPGPTFPVPDAGPGPENPEPRNPVNPVPTPMPPGGGPITIVVVPPATFGASGEQMQLNDAGIRDAPPTPDAAPRMDAPPTPDARPTQDALMPPSQVDAGRPQP